MRISDIIEMGKEYVLLGICFAIVVLFVFVAAYFIVYKKFMHGKKQLHAKGTFWKILLAIYLVVVFGVTLLGRYDGWQNGEMQPIFSSYKEAWYTGNVTEWQNIILNICMFVPYGVLLPLAFTKMRSFWKTYLAGALTTVLIESVQLIFHRGVFEFDDIMNNFLGTMIGYGVSVLILSIFRRKNAQRISWKKVVLLQLPLLFTISAFLGLKISYEQMEFGTLSCHYIHKVNLDKNDVKTSLELSDQETELPVYKMQVLSQDETKQFAAEFLQNLGTEIDSSRDDIYTETAIYSDKDSRYTISIDYKGGTYQLTDFETSFPQDDSEVIYQSDATEEGIYVPAIK